MVSGVDGNVDVGCGDWQNWYPYREANVIPAYSNAKVGTSGISVWVSEMSQYSNTNQSQQIPNIWLEGMLPWC